MKPTIMILKYLIAILSNLKTIHVADHFDEKLEASVKLSALISPFVVLFWKGTKFFAEHFMENGLVKNILVWYVDNTGYIFFVLLAIVVDHTLGTIKHLVKKQFSIKRNISGLITKIGLVVACGILFEGLNFIVEKENFLKDYLVIVTRLIVFLYPAGSAFGNSTFLSNGKFPPQSWLDKLKSFEKNLNTKDIVNKEENINN